MAAERRFRAMGSDAHVVVVGGHSHLADAAVRRVDDLERRWSRFLSDSEVCTINRAAGTFVEVSADTAGLVRHAIDAWHLSGGAFDPTVLGAVIRAGYDRPFDELLPDAPGARSPLGTGAGDIVVDGCAVRLPAGTGFDAGGIGKGLAADLVCAELLAAGADGACVNLGGDVRVAGAGPDGGGWTVAVEHPWCPEPIATLGVGDGAVATSTTLRRRWTAGGVPRHHLIDPRTSRPSETDVNLAAVVAAHAWVAEVLAKAVVLAGSEHPFDIVGGTGAEALAVDERGRLSSTPGLGDYLGGASLRAAIPAARSRVP